MINSSSNSDTVNNNTPSTTETKKEKRKYNKKEKKSIPSSEKIIKRRFHWSQDQTVKYCMFIHEYQQTLSKTKKRQKQKIYNQMHIWVQTRSKEQCKSHHQKMLERHKTINNIILAHQKLNQKNVDMMMMMKDHEDVNSKKKQDATLKTQKPKDLNNIQLDSKSNARGSNAINEHSVNQESEIQKDPQDLGESQYINQMLNFDSDNEFLQPNYYEDYI